MAKRLDEVIAELVYKFKVNNRSIPVREPKYILLGQEEYKILKHIHSVYMKTPPADVFMGIPILRLIADNFMEVV